MAGHYPVLGMGGLQLGQQALSVDLYNALMMMMKMMMVWGLADQLVCEEGRLGSHFC